MCTPVAQSYFYQDNSKATSATHYSAHFAADHHSTILHNIDPSRLVPKLKDLELKTSLCMSDPRWLGWVDTPHPPLSFTSEHPRAALWVPCYTLCTHICVATFNSNTIVILLMTGVWSLITDNNEKAWKSGCQQDSWKRGRNYVPVMGGEDGQLYYYYQTTKGLTWA